MVHCEMLGTNIYDCWQNSPVTSAGGLEITGVEASESVGPYPDGSGVPKGVADGAVLALSAPPCRPELWAFKERL
jgi:hypothetical protein